MIETLDCCGLCGEKVAPTASVLTSVGLDCFRSVSCCLRCVRGDCVVARLCGEVGVREKPRTRDCVTGFGREEALVLDIVGGLLVEVLLVEKTCFWFLGTGEKLKLLDFKVVTLFTKVD